MGNLSIMKHLHREPSAGLARLLIPIDATEESRWGVRYALRRAESGVRVEVFLLYIAEPVRNWEVLRFRTEEEVRNFFQERSAVFLEEAAAPLRQAQIPFQTYFRETQLVPGVSDFSEEFGCTEIVVPRTAWFGIFPYGLAPKLLKQKCSVPVTLTKADGSTDV